MSLKKDLDELLDAEVITDEMANRIRAYYMERKGGRSPHRLILAFGVLGALLVGLGVILIIAHNWDKLQRPVKLLFAFLPLLIAQGIALYTLLRKSGQSAWREGSAVFLTFAIGASISLVSQIYHIMGDLSSFLLVWSLLVLPIVYILRSSMASLLYLIGITAYACHEGYNYPSTPPTLYWLLLGGAVPFYYRLCLQAKNSNFTFFHHWFFPLSLITVLGGMAERQEELMLLAYFSLFGVLYLMGKLPYFSTLLKRQNGYQVIGVAGMMFMLLIWSFDEPWREVSRHTFYMSGEVFLPIAFVLLNMGMLYLYWPKDKKDTIDPLAYISLVFVLIFLVGTEHAVAASLLVNTLLLLVGVWVVINGSKRQALGELNFGMLLLAALISCRFFDSDLSFVSRGILFVVMGVGFFMANYWMLKKRTGHEGK
ncbi:DUF2157 domain-containing protein [Algivirga pacifica]|uniref:DUF2157 domain-containing protein n=1 Tax=Algivirga pacifica TaxID=1162670 RepID=A0ABP9DIC9_9BACT